MTKFGSNMIFVSNMAPNWQSSVTWAACRLAERQTCRPRPWHFQMPRLTSSFICKYPRYACAQNPNMFPLLVTLPSLHSESPPLWFGGKLFTHLIDAFQFFATQMNGKLNEQSGEYVPLVCNLHISELWLENGKDISVVIWRHSVWLHNISR